MRNSHLKTVRKLWKEYVLPPPRPFPPALPLSRPACLSSHIASSSSARIFFGRGAVMAKALGTTPEEAHRPGLHKLATQIKGQVGLLFTDSPPAEVTEWFADFAQPDFARAGNAAARAVVLPAGPVLQRHASPPEPFPHNEEPQLRRLGLRTRMERGVPTLDAPHTVCEAGKALSPEQAQLLKLIGIKMVTFRVGLRARWDAATGEVEQFEGQAVEDASAEAEEGSGDEDEEQMSE